MKFSMNDLKKTLALFLICLLVITTRVNGEGSQAEDNDQFDACIQQCMPVCLKEDGATSLACDPACNAYCVQIARGNGPFGK